MTVGWRTRFFVAFPKGEPLLPGPVFRLQAELTLLRCICSQTRDARAAVSRNSFVSPFDELQPKEESGDAKAQLALGLLYENPTAPSMDQARAAEWIRKA